MASVALVWAERARETMAVEGRRGDRQVRLDPEDLGDPCQWDRQWAEDRLGRRGRRTQPV